MSSEDEQRVGRFGGQATEYDKKFAGQRLHEEVSCSQSEVEHRSGYSKLCERPTSSYNENMDTGAAREGGDLKHWHVDSEALKRRGAEAL